MSKSLLDWLWSSVVVFGTWSIGGPTLLMVLLVVNQQVAVAQDQIEERTVTGRLDENNETLNDGRYAARYEFEGYEEAIVDIELVSDEFDAYLILVGPDGNRIAENDDYDDSNARLVIQLPSNGNYVVFANTYTAAENGNYTLSWRNTSANALKNYHLLVEAAQMNQQAVDLYQRGQYEEALPIAQRALIIREGTLGANHLDVAQSLNNLALLYQIQGNYAEALTQYERALMIRETALGPNHLDVAQSLNNLAALYQDQGNYAEALLQYEQALTIYESVLGPDHPEVATSLNNLASLYQDQSNYAEALPRYEQALTVLKTTLGPDHPEVATSLNNLASLYQDQGNYAEALPRYEQVLMLDKTTLGPNHPSVAISLNNIASLHQIQGNYAEALPRHEEALMILETAFGLDHPDVAQSLNNIASLYQDQGNYAEALPRHEQALAIREAAFGPDHPDVAQSLNNIALLYQDQGNYAKALPRYEQALMILETAFGLDHSSVATSLNNIASLYKDQGNYAEALPRYEQALMILKAAFGPDHPDVAQSLNNIALLYQGQGNYAEALPRYEQALMILETAFGLDHSSVATSLNNIASLYQDQGNYAEALPRYEQALTILKTVLRPNHPNVAMSLNNLARLYQVQGNLENAIVFFQQAAEIEEDNLLNIFISSPEAERQLYLNTLRGTTNTLHSLNFETNDSSAANLALTTTLRRKGRILDSVTGSFQQLRTQLSFEDEYLIDNLNAIRAQLATLHSSNLSGRSPEQYRALFTDLVDQAEQLETTLSRLNAAFRTESQPATIDVVQALITKDTALVELVRYAPSNFKDPRNRWTASPRYAAYILTAEGHPQFIDLGEAAPIDALVADFRRALGTHSLRTQTIARQLDELVMAPIRPLLGNNTHILLSPDSQLNLIPFAALVTEDNRYLVEDYQITYLNSGRDLLRLQLDNPSQQGPVILANPDYAGSNASTQISQKSTAKNNEKQSNQRSVDITNLTFNPLPGTAAEAEAIAPLLNNATILTGTNATENALKQVTAPSILHIATHGFFLEDVERFVPLDTNSRGFRAALVPSPLDNNNERPTQATPRNTENPLLRSGLALAGFNQRNSGSEDGVLTALEASGLNLYGTKLVVLSACDTGVGEVSTGEGVYGLRRAFVTAGAESQLMSLWQVSDYGTSELMQLYYQNLKDGQGRSEALRSAQLTLLETGQYQHPYFWASFIFSGDWSPLEGI